MQSNVYKFIIYISNVALNVIFDSNYNLVPMLHCEDVPIFTENLEC